MLSTVLLILSQQTAFMPFLSVLLGFSLGIGLPTSMAFIADYSYIDERAQISGLTIFATFILAISAMIITEIFAVGLPTLILLFAIVRSTSFLGLVFNKFDVEDKVEEKLHKPSSKDFLFYIIPWMMFVLVGTLAWSLIPLQFESAVSIGRIR